MISFLQGECKKQGNTESRTSYIYLGGYKMKMRKRIISVAAAMMLSATMLPTDLGSAVAADKTVKIMPLGDSITYGIADEGGYRK